MQGRMFIAFARLTPWQDHGEYARYPFNQCIKRLDEVLFWQARIHIAVTLSGYPVY
jgi:hypothetical protein